VPKRITAHPICGFPGTVRRERRSVQDGRRFDLASAFAAADADALPHWVGEFLASRGSDNATLAAALALREHWWLGPLRLPLDLLVPLAGPDDDALCPVDAEEWEEDVGTMEDSIEEGWEPAPLLAQFDRGDLLLQDGNHRYEALRRSGETHAWVLLWFDDPEDLGVFRDKVRAAAQ
jgi:hypothetical protein